MRLATARDEIEPLRDAAVRTNEAYLTVLLLARIVTRIGDVTDVTPELIEELYAADFDHLQRLYERINTDGEVVGIGHVPGLLSRVRGRPDARSRTVAWGNDAAVSAGALRGGGPARPPPPLAAGRDPRPRAPRPAPLPSRS